MLNNIYNLFFRRLFSFKGRSSRKEYIARFLLTAFIGATWSYTEDFRNAEGILSFIYVTIISVLGDICIFQYIPLSIRRLHDTNNSGWWLLLHFIPLGQLIIIWLIFKRGTLESNKYGSSSDNYEESKTTLKYNLLICCGIFLSPLLLFFFKI